MMGQSDSGRDFGGVFEGAFESDGQARAAAMTVAVSRLVGEAIADVERELILQTLHRCGGNRSAAAVMLGISVRTMRNKLRSFLADGTAVPPSLGGGVMRHALSTGA